MSNLFPEENDEISEAEKFPPGKFVENDREPPRKGAISLINGVSKAEIWLNIQN